MHKYYGHFLLILTISCTPTNDGEDLRFDIENTKSRTLEIHDEVMVHMGKLRKIKKELSLVDSTDSKQQTILIQTLIDDLENADKAMWDWMHHYDHNYASGNDSLTLVYFKKEEKEITKIKMAIDSVITQGSRFLDYR